MLYSEKRGDDLIAFDKKKKKDISENKKEISTSRVSVIPQDLREINNTNSKTTNLLSKITNTSNAVDCIDIIIHETADGSMAYNTYLRLANQGFNVVWKNADTGKTVKKYDSEFRAFCSRMGRNNSAGIDGLLDVLHGCSIARGGMAVEVVVDKGATDIEEIAIVDPASIVEFKWIDSEKRYAAYQQQSSGQKVDLYEGNFYYVPFEPKPGHPEGTLKFLPAIVTTTQYLQTQQDSGQILNRIGYPRYDFCIDRKSFFDSVLDKSPSGFNKACNELFDTIRANARMLKHNSDFVHFDEVKVDTIGGGVNGAGIDIRAWFEVLEPQIINAFQLTPVLLGRLSAGSYSLGSVEFKIVTDTVDSMRRGSKRILENIFRLWARVKGYNIVPEVKHNPIDWEKEKEKIETHLMKQELWRRSEEYGYISKDRAAMEVSGTEKADNQNTVGLYEYLSHDFKEPTEPTTSTMQSSTSSLTTDREAENV